MGVAGVDKSAGLPNRDVELGALRKLDQIDIARMGPWRNRAGDAWTEWRKVVVGRRHAECTLNGLERYIDVRCKACPHVRQIKLYIFHLPLRKILRQQAGP